MTTRVHYPFLGGGAAAWPFSGRATDKENQAYCVSSRWDTADALNIEHLRRLPGRKARNSDTWREVILWSSGDLPKGVLSFSRTCSRPEIMTLRFTKGMAAAARGPNRSPD